MKRFRIMPVCFITYPALMYFCGVRLFAPLILAVLIHECGHLAALRIFSVKAVGFTVTPTGLDIRRGACSYTAELVISLAGPAFGCAAAIVCFALGAQELFCANLACSLVNLLPVMPLDGGAALQAALFKAFNMDRAQRLQRAVATLTLAALYIAAVMMLLYTGWNVTLLAVCAVLFFSLISG